VSTTTLRTTPLRGVEHIRRERPRSKGRVRLSLLDLPLRRDQLLELIPENLRRGLARESSEDPLA